MGWRILPEDRVVDQQYGHNTCDEESNGKPPHYTFLNSIEK